MRISGKTYATFKKFRDEHVMEDCLIVVGDVISLDYTFRESRFLCACYAVKYNFDKKTIEFPNGKIWKFIIAKQDNLRGTYGPYLYEKRDGWFYTEVRL